jgi:uncharacterized protein involved in exopolysaccharide biosynthesis
MGSEDVQSSEIDVPSVGGEVVARACIAVVGGKDSGAVYPLMRRETVIGRGREVEIRFDQGSISTRHAVIVANGDRHSLTDLGSTNGTYLNGRRLEAEQPTPLTFGDSIQVADIVLAYVEAQKGHGRTGQTYQLAVVSPQFGDSAGPRMTDHELILQLLRGEPPAELKPPAASLDEQIDKLLRVLAFFRRNWVPIFSATALFTLVATTTVFLSPPPTEATAKLRISMKSSEGLDRRPVQREEIAQFFSAAEQNFVSPSLVERTLTDIEKRRPSREDVSTTLSNLKLESTGYGTYEPSFTHEDPEFALGFLRQHLKNYLANEVQRTIRGIQAEVDFSSARLQENEAELRKTEEELRQFKGKHIDGLPEYAKEHFVSRESLQSRRSELAAQLERTNLELALAKKRLQEAAPLLTTQVEKATPYETGLVEARRKLAETRAKGFGEQHPEVVSLRKQIDDLERLALKERTTTATKLERDANPALIELKNKVGDLQVASSGISAELGQVGSQLARIASIVKEMPEVEEKYAQLTRSYNVSREQHAKLFERLKTAQLQLELERSSASARYEMVAPAESDGVPLRKALFKRTLIGAMLGLMLGLVLALVFELKNYLKHRTKTPQTALARVGYASHPPAQ